MEGRREGGREVHKATLNFYEHLLFLLFLLLPMPLPTKLVTQSFLRSLDVCDGIKVLVKTDKGFQR